MSADNYMYVDVKDGVFQVWMGFASDDRNPTEFGNPMFESTDVVEAIAFASKECEEGVVEYGMTVSPEAQKEMQVTTMKKDSMRLTSHGWKKSDKSDNSADRDGWSFVASHAEEIVRFLWTEGK